MDLKNAPDHPAKILTKAVEGYGPTSATRIGHIVAAHALRAHEDMENVTFAALDDEDLDNVRTDYTNLREALLHHNNEPAIWLAADNLADSIRDLLGLDDAAI